MPNKKIIFVIVEGPTDDLALGAYLTRIYDRKQVYIHIVHGDLTTQFDVNPSNVLKYIKEMVETYAKGSHFRKADFCQVVHIVDMDGAYIPDDSITEDRNMGKPFYTLNEIMTDSVSNLKERNRRKRLVLEKLSSCSSIWSGIPYQVYYMSCNLDHVLYDYANLTNEEKEKNALRFATQYGNNLDAFVSFISESGFSVCDEYLKSWSFIKQGHNSLHRFTNLGICLNRALENKNDESDEK